VHVADESPTSSGKSGAENGDEPVAADAGTGGDEPTEMINPADPDPTAVVPPDPDSTAIVPPDLDATRLTPSVDPDATQAGSGPDNASTHVIRPPTPDPTEAFAPVPPTWRGSAGVRPGGPQSDATSTWSPQQPSGRSWWLPSVIGIIGLLIIVGVAYALVRALNDKGQPAPAISSTPAATATTATPSATPSTVPSAPPSASPSPSASTSPSASPSASFVVIPSTLTGLLFTDVGPELNSMGLKYVLKPQVDTDTSVLPGTVLSTNPSAGASVPLGTVVTIVYAEPPTSPPASPTVTP
jgi:PASTA domain-containing protein